MSILELEPEIQRHYDRTIASVDDRNEPDSPKYLRTSDVLRAHYLIANHFYLEGEGLGGVGPRDIGLLQSAVHRQFSGYGGNPRWSDKFDILATLYFGLIKNHAFHDANKRTAFLSALYLMHRQKYCPSVSQQEFEDFTVLVAENQLIKFSRFQSLLDKETDPEVKFISWFFRNNTRQVDRSEYIITYHELRRILNRFGFGLENLRGNHIDVVRYEKRRTLLGLGPEKSYARKILQIGMPRWTAQVGKAALKSVRRECGLSGEDGVDSASFFNGLDPMKTLIRTYHEPLKRLAHR